MRKVVLLAATTLVVALGATASSATSAASETGITARTITIGGSFPLSGPVSLYATIPAAMKAYFSYINSRKGPDGRRGIYGRQIVFKIYDDQYNPAQTVQMARKLVEDDKVFAIVGQLGTEHNEAIRPYMNQNKVPQILNATGASEWYTPANVAKYPWTRGWFPDYEFESRICTGRRSHATARTRRSQCCSRTTASGKDNLRGLKLGLGAKASNIVGEERYEVTASDVRSQVAKLRATGANVLVIVATPRIMIQTYAIANALGWKPPVIYTTLVSATDIFLTLAQRSGGGDLPNNTYSAAVPQGSRQPQAGTTTPR